MGTCRLPWRIQRASPELSASSSESSDPRAPLKDQGPPSPRAPPLTSSASPNQSIFPSELWSWLPLAPSSAHRPQHAAPESSPQASLRHTSHLSGHLPAVLMRYSHITTPITMSLNTLNTTPEHPNTSTEAVHSYGTPAGHFPTTVHMGPIPRHPLSTLCTLSTRISRAQGPPRPGSLLDSAQGVGPQPTCTRLCAPASYTSQSPAHSRHTRPDASPRLCTPSPK